MASGVVNKADGDIGFIYKAAVNWRVKCMLLLLMNIGHETLQAVEGFSGGI
ncbi:hypothetical protein [Vogesella alkaliphila]|uniref:hypothetical protein n=1 Tax=Vogesella alkaliphila TaxID=1193621 RepID=UPI001675C3A4|nr:hypothetical protein [Vogesella alkaliphila]